jgi:tetratricopeptide (TPR) repeat protein
MAAIPGNVPERPRAGAPREDGAGPDHLVITVHGIRTYGDWQADLKRLLEEAEPGIIVRNFQYGYFSALAFLVPFLRWIVARRFRKFLVHAIRSVPSDARIDVVAHSFGTYLAASALKAVPEGRRINTIILAGSVLRPTFPWFKYQEAGTLGRVVNECGWDDNVLLLCQATALMLGMAGRVGFQAMMGDDFANRYFRGGHGLYFDREQRFMRQRWLPLLTSNAPIPAVNERPPLTPLGGGKLFLLNNMHVLKIAGAMVVLLALILVPLDWYRKADYQRRVERERHITMLTNAEQIPQRDPDHVRELLRIDVRAMDLSDANAKSTNHAFSNDPLPVDDETLDDEDEPSWWDRVTGATNKAYVARLRHAQANSQLSADKHTNGRDLSKAKLQFEEAIKAYQSVKDKEPTYGSYALCLLDYGMLLTELGELDKAIEQYHKIRTDVFPVDTKTGGRPTMPLSLQIDSLCSEAEALKRQEKWTEAGTCQFEAYRLAKDHDDLLSYVCNEIAWLKLERLEVRDAQKYFDQAKVACDGLVNDGRFVFTTRLYHVRHGLAMAERLLGNSAESYNQYDQIVNELRVLMRDDLKFQPKERKDLRMRLVNSLERRADVFLFARQPLGRDDDETSRASWSLSPAKYRDQMKKLQRDYQQVIEYVENDDALGLIPLLYKKVIVRCLTEVVDDQPAKPVSIAGVMPPDREMPELQPVDIEFSGAERAFLSLPHERRKSLEIYRDIARRMMDLRHASGVSRARAVADMRRLTESYSAKCETLRRDHVEMLLVALETLLDVETDADKNAIDASRMMGVLGTSTKVNSHAELQPYVARFNQIASRKLVPPAKGSLVQASLEAAGTQGSLPSPSNTFFYMRLGPRWSITLTRGAQPPSSGLASAKIAPPSWDHD